MSHSQVALFLFAAGSACALAALPHSSDLAYGHSASSQTAAPQHRPIAAEHYGQMIIYLRLNGIVPPTSRPNPPPLSDK